MSFLDEVSDYLTDQDISWSRFELGVFGFEVIVAWELIKLTGRFFGWLSS